MIAYCSYLSGIRSGDSSPQNQGCNAPKPLRSSEALVPIPIRSPHQFMILSNVTISSHIISYSASTFLILKRFDRHNWPFSHSDNIFIASCETGGAKPKLGWNCSPRSNAEPPLYSWKPAQSCHVEM